MEVTPGHAGNVGFGRKEGTIGRMEFLRNLNPEDFSAIWRTDGFVDPIAFGTVFRPNAFISMSRTAEKRAKSEEPTRSLYSRTHLLNAVAMNCAAKNLSGRTFQMDIAFRVPEHSQFAARHGNHGRIRICQ